MTALSDLIARLEAAKEGSRELDRKIAFAVNWNGFQNEDQIYKENADDIPNWTQSLDAALTLVPEGWGAEIFWHDGATAADAYVDLRLPNPRWKEPDCPTELLSTYAALVSSYEDDDRPINPDEPYPLPRAKPLALALCIAAMKARESAR